MPKLISRDGPTGFTEAADPFAPLADDTALEADVADVIVSVARFHADGEALLADGRRVGVPLNPDHAVEDLAYDQPPLALVALEFSRFRDGRPYSAAMLLRGRYGFAGEVRAVGEVLRDQAFEMARCGFDAFEPADGSTSEQWAGAALRFRHVYQAAADGRTPAYRERTGEG